MSALFVLAFCNAMLHNVHKKNVDRNEVSVIISEGGKNVKSKNREIKLKWGISCVTANRLPERCMHQMDASDKW